MFDLFSLLLLASDGRFFHMDVKSSFLRGDLSEEIYMENPSDFVTDSNLVCWLQKLVYGLKQAHQD